MYHPVKIEGLSKQQISRLLNGHPVRVRHGSTHTIHVSKEQHKKLVKASSKGSGLNLTLDPFQIHEHQHLRGEGIRGAIKKVGHFVKHHKEAFRPLASALKETGHQALADLQSHAIQSGVDPNLVHAYGNMAHDIIPGGSLKSFFRSPGMKVVRKALRPIGQAAWNDINGLAMQGLSQANSAAQAGLATGMGFGYRGGSLKSFVRSPGMRVVRKALRPIGQAAWNDINGLAMQGLSQANTAAQTGLATGMGLGSRIGLGLRRGRPKKHVRHHAHGGSLYPAGY